ncbi:MAG: hypothetical protein WCF95_06680 [bacterium]
MRIQSQNTNFKAIKIKGIDPESKQYWQMHQATGKYNLEARWGQSRWGFYSRYVHTKLGSEMENSLLSDLLKLFGADKKIKIKTCEDLEAKTNYNRFLTSK